jgi:phosphate transport system substrate-binding protein
MKTSQNKYISILPLAILLALAAFPRLQGSVLLRPVFAQSAPSAPLPPSSVPADTVVRVEGSSSMAAITQTLKQGFEQQYPGAKVNPAIAPTNDALQALKAGKIDVAASGRPLTKDEKAAGLVAVPVARHKIALVVKEDNPFRGTLTIEQFAQIFRGEITNWADVDGTDAPVRLVDRPATSDTRQAFLNYDVFQSAPFKTGESAVTVTKDETAAVIEKLGNDGVGYAIAEQVIDQPGIRIVSLYDTFPDNPKYPFSQPLTYVYKEPASPAVQAFLGYAATPGTAVEIEKARVQAAKLPETGTVAAIPDNSQTAPSGSTNQQDGQNGNDFGWLWWLLLPLLGIPLLAWWLKDRMGAAAVAPIEAAGEQSQNSRIILTPRNCQDAYAYWEVPEAAKKALQQQGGNQLLLRLYDVTGIDIKHQPPHSMRQFECREGMQDTHLPIALDDRDYLVELGYVTDDDRWLSLAHSAPVRVPPCSPERQGLNMGAVATTGALAGVTAAIAHGQDREDPAVRQPVYPSADCRIILAPRNCRDVYAYWELTQTLQTQLRQEGREKLAIRLCDVTNIDPDRQSPHSIRQFEFDARAQDVHLPIAVDNRDYLVELGYPIAGNRWVKLGRSEPVRVPQCSPIAETQSATSAARSPRVGMAPTSDFLGGSTLQNRAPIPSNPDLSQIILAPHGGSNAYVSWNLSDFQKQSALSKGGQKMALRLYDVTNINLDYQPPYGVYEYECSEADRDRHLSIPAGDRDYLIEIGYVTNEGRWLKLARSEAVHIPTTEV